ncbi:pim-1 oncogene [Armadillidium vulgare iridescent virus]|uniref:Serine/threonine-protein kinase 1 n=1 Tax=Armadillidium vulgare iridescent virus TaxID=72201 RepID=A0A068QLQ7_9VIRU|nr:pim-1 oncogene [Armadillidium vulgare iridescent virus]CCV02499.1 pim-1 oncogene [Armadillidium vulgare iridescent virus]
MNRLKKRFLKYEDMNIEIIRNEERVRSSLQDFKIGEVLGQGGFGTVYSGIEISTGVEFALKEISIRAIRKEKKRSFEDPYLPFEIIALKQLYGVDGVIKLFDWFYINQTIDSFKKGESQGDFIVACVIVLEKPEKCQDLFDYLTQNHPIGFETIKTIFKQVIEISLACCDNEIYHRDLKDENILIYGLGNGSGKELKIRLIDFGGAAFAQEEPYTDFAGTIVFNPPEVFLKERYFGDKATVWSLGILLYDMVFGDVPWQTKEEVIRGSLYFPESQKAMRGNNVTEYRKITNLIQQCLSKKENDRIDLKDILKHKWFLD